jgi:uncharacterized lipoprotein YehR (DUF1307 family)
MNKKLKKYLAMLLLATMCLLSFSGCSSSEEKELDYSDTYVKGQDSQENLVGYQGLSY